MNIDDYKVKLPYPDRPNRPRLCPNPTSTDARIYSKDLQKWEEDMAKHSAKIDAYRKEEADCHSRFKSDVLRENGLEGHPKSEKVFAMAWEHGHSSGYHEVSQWVAELSELVVTP